jgi:biopolymer transport protein ExbD
MVITPLTPHGLDALAPQPPPPNQPPPPPDQDRTVVIVIDKDKSMKLNQDPILENQLQNRLNEIFKTRAERVVFVKGDPDLDFEVVARAIDIAKGANMEKVGLMTPKTELGQ